MYRDEREPFEDAGVVLRLLLDEPTVHFAKDELVRELNWPPAQLEDALAELARAGLAHRRDGFVFPSRAAVRCHELLI
jgi:hypothetical protein